MKIVTTFFVLILFPFFGFSQIGGEDEVYLNGDLIEAQFNGGGLENFSDYLTKNFDYSKVSKPGKLEATFTIDVEGNVTKIRITQVLDTESALEFVRVLKLCPKWEPAKRGGKPISIEIKYPLIFKEKIKSSANNEFTEKPISGPDSESDLQLYDIASVETKPDYIGGLQKFYQFIAENYRVPDIQGINGKVIVSFIVEKDGSLTDIKVIKDIGYGAGKEAVRVLEICPKWAPGRQNGKPIRCIYSLPISIRSR